MNKDDKAIAREKIIARINDTIRYGEQAAEFELDEEAEARKTLSDITISVGAVEVIVREGVTGDHTFLEYWTKDQDYIGTRKIKP